MSVKFTIPKDCSQITLGEWLDWGMSDDPYKTVIAFTELTEETIRNVPHMDIQYLSEEINKAMESPLATLRRRIKINGVEYGFEPNIDDVTAGAYIDLENFEKEEDVLSMMCVLYRPIIRSFGKQYEIEPYDTKHMNNKKDLRQLTLDQVNGVRVFFSTLESELLMISRSCLLKEAEKQVRKAKELLT
jgi:hypothetical protein